MSRLFLLCLLTAGFLLTPAPLPAESALPVVSASSVPDLWKADQHLYVKGDVGLPAAPLGALESWLDANAPHWTVVLMKNAAGESWQDKATGGMWNGMDAVENALGRGLPASTAFGQFTHPKTGERDGAWLVIFLAERKFSYWASDAYDRRNLGEDHWQGNLDSPARQAMRGGGRLVDAVQDTITSIDGELNRRIAHEAETKRQETERLANLRARTTVVIAELRQSVQRLTEQAAALKLTSPQATGTLTKPPVSGWLADLDEAARQIAAARTQATSSLLEQVQSGINTWEKEYGAWRTAPADLLALQQELDKINLHPWSVSARNDLLAARTWLKEATEAHSRADQGISKSVKAATARLEAARLADAGTRNQATLHTQLSTEANAASYPTETTAMKLVTEARQALTAYADQREAGADGGNLLTEARQFLTKAGQIHAAGIRRAETLRQTGQAGSIAGAGALLLGGWAGNRRRRKVRERALLTFREWEEALQKKTTELFTLLDRAGRAIGTSATLERSGWDGTTRQLAAQTIQDVDQLFVMSSALDQVLERARSLIQPSNPLTKTRNLVSGGRYQAALDLLEKESIQFSPDSQIPTILRTAPEQEWKGLLGRREDCEPFALTFSGLNDAFNARATRALSALDRIDTAWTRINTALTELDTAILAAAAIEKQVNTAEASDRRFGVNAVFNQLIPSAQEDAATATRLSVADPVQALDGPWTSGSRKASEATALCQAILDLRAHQLPVIQQNGETLTKSSRQTEWIGTALDSLSTQADHLAAGALTASISTPLHDWIKATRALREQTSLAVALMERAGAKSLPALQELDARILTERTRLAGLLNLKPDQILTEPDRNPTTTLTDARARHEAALTELDRGDNTAAQASLDEAARLVAHAHGLIVAAIDSQENHAKRMLTLANESTRLEALLPEHATLLDSLRVGWAPAALRPAAADPAWPDPDDSIADNLRRAEDLLESARTHIQQGDEALRRGALLEAVDLHQEAGEDQSNGEIELDTIVKQRDAIVAMVQANAAESARLSRHCAGLELLANEPVSMAPTRQDFLTVSQELETALAKAAATGPAADPFTAARALTAAGAALTALEQRLQSDREAFAEASRSVEFASRQLAAAGPLIRQAQQDNVPDSAATQQAGEILTQLQDRVTELTQALRRAHGDWPAIDVAADKTATDAANWRARLQGELQRAAASVEALQRATKIVREAGGWSGALGVRIGGVPGRDLLEQARHALDRGEYDHVIAAAQAAHQEAQRAIAAAEAEQRRRRQERERQEEQRRREAAASRASSFASHSSSSSRRSSSGGSSSRSSSRSSFSSGSGASRSGW